jgi:hypothetical protein
MQRLHYMPADSSLNMSKQSFGLGFQNYQSNGKTFIGHGGGCPGYKSFLLMRPQEKLAYIAMFNVGDIDSRHFAHELYDLTASDVTAAAAGAGGAAASDPLADYEGVYGTEGYVWDVYAGGYKGDLIVADLFAASPAKGISRYRRTEPDLFRLIRDDGSLGDELRFERDGKGKAVRLWQDSDFLERLDLRPSG